MKKIISAIATTPTGDYLCVVTQRHLPVIVVTYFPLQRLADRSRALFFWIKNLYARFQSDFAYKPLKGRLFYKNATFCHLYLRVFVVLGYNFMAR